LVTLLAAIQATGLLALTLTGLTPAEHTSLSWTYNLVQNFTTLASQIKIWLLTKYSLNPCPFYILTINNNCNTLFT